MSPRTGRPTNDPKKKSLRIRMSDEAMNKLKFCCDKTGLSQSEIIRIGLDKVYKELHEK